MAREGVVTLFTFASGFCIVISMSDFEWTDSRQKAAISLAEGNTRKQAAKDAGVDDRTIYRWLDVPEFSEEVDRLTLMTGIALRSERIKIAKRVVRQKAGEELKEIETTKDLLDWLKYAQGETDGIKLDLMNLLEAMERDSSTITED